MNAQQNEKINVGTLSSTNRAAGASAASMRKYQQLALTIISIVSLAAFLFYKHEYDRLRFTFEFLETFGTVGDEDSLVNSCGISLHRKLTTAPTSWIKLDTEVVVYSAFLDESVTPSLIRIIAAVRKGYNNNDFKAFYWSESDDAHVGLLCNLEKFPHYSDSSNELEIKNIVCKPKAPKLDAYIMRFTNGDQYLPPIFVQESESWKRVSNISCMCVFSTDISVLTVQIIEFVAFHHSIGIEKFTFYGNVLTPLSRTLLDKYGDEIGLFYEEKQFILPSDFILSENQKRKVIEMDCMQRHRNTHENVLTMKLNQFVLPRTKASFIAALDALSPPGRKTPLIPKATLMIQKVCIDEHHKTYDELYLSSKIRKVGDAVDGVSIFRPHLATLDHILDQPNLTEKIPISLSVVHSFQVCNDIDHPDTDHLAINKAFSLIMQKSLLFRKWKIIN